MTGADCGVTIIAAAVFTILLPLLAGWLPFAATIVAVWVLAGVALMVAWCGAIELLLRRRQRRFNEHTEQALTIVNGDDL